MDSQIPPADSVAATAPRSWRVLATVLVVGSLIMIAAVFGRQLLLQRAADANFDPDPAPRPRLNAPFIKSPDVVVDKMIEVAQLTKDDLVYDLGCGDGRIIVTAALKRGCHGVGFDIDPERVAEANKNVEVHDVARLVSIKEQDIFKLDLSQANVAIMYLLPWMMQELAPQFDQMKAGSRIVSHDFYIEGVEPERVVNVFVESENSRHVVYLYTAPLRWNPDMPKKPPVMGLADRADAEKAAAARDAAEKETARKTAGESAAGEKGAGEKGKAVKTDAGK